MNQLIQELASKAFDKANDGTVDIKIPKQFIETFAELILAGCEKVISNGQYSDMACEGNSHRISYNNGRYGAVVDIKKYFGIKP